MSLAKEAAKRSRPLSEVDLDKVRGRLERLPVETLRKATKGMEERIWSDSAAGLPLHSHAKDPETRKRLRNIYEPVSTAYARKEWPQ